MIYDCFLFDNEIDCLQIRLRELRGLTDVTVIVEGDMTHQGGWRQPWPKSLLWCDLDQYGGGELRHLVVPLPKERPEGIPESAELSVVRAITQRNAILEGLGDAKDDDLVLVSDCDEIIRREAFIEALDLMLRLPIACVAFEMDQFYFRMNLLDTCEQFYGPRLIRRKHLTWPHNFRRHHPVEGEHVLKHAGWHFGWLGDTAHQLNKIRSFSHPELNTPEIANPEFLETCLRSRMTAHNGHLLERLVVDDRFPLLVQEEPKRFARLIA